MKISIIGDSFSSDTCDHSWIKLLSEKYEIDNFSQRGISEYRILKILEKNLETIKNSDVVIIFHTNADRIYVPDLTDYPRRRLDTHQHCDMLASDAFSMPAWAAIADVYYRNFFDFEFQQHIFSCTMQKIINVVEAKNKVIHCSGFECNTNKIYSFAQLRDTNPGIINHFDIDGNLQVFNYILDNLT